MASFSLLSQATWRAGHLSCLTSLQCSIAAKKKQQRAALEEWHTVFSSDQAAASFRGPAHLFPLSTQRAAPTVRFSGCCPLLASTTSLYSQTTEELEEQKTTRSQLVSESVPTVLTITIPEESFGSCFEADYGSEAATWPEDLGTTRDYHKMEEFVTSAHALVRRWLMPDIVARLERFIHDPSQPPVLVIRGLPVDTDLPATGWDGSSKLGKYVSETWLVGISRIIGQPFLQDAVRSDRPGMSLLVRDLYTPATTPEKVEQAGSEGSCKFLDFHVDYFQVRPDSFPSVLAFIGLRGDDAAKTGQIMVCDFHKLYTVIDPSHVKILREEKITWEHAGAVFSKYVIEGPEDSPIFNLFEESLFGSDSFDKFVSGSIEAITAYKQVKEIAKQVGSEVEGVWLAGGDVCLINQRKAAFSHSAYTANNDANDQWIQHTYINEGTFWLPRGLVPYPIRSLPMVLQ